jgi:hypothetical protein
MVFEDNKKHDGVFYYFQTEDLMEKFIELSGPKNKKKV